MMELEYKFKTRPWKHQLEIFERTKDLAHFALLMEMRTGKTKIILDTAARLHQANMIDALWVIAPNGVHVNWIMDEAPAHLREETYFGLYTRRGRWLDKNKKPLCSEPPRGKLQIMTVNVEAYSSDGMFEKTLAFLKTHRTMLVVDESDAIKTPKAQRTKNVLKLAPFAPYRRVLTGTPGEKPFDLYAQFKFLSPHIFNCTYTAFKHEYGHFAKETNWRAGKTYEALETEQYLKNKLEHANDAEKMLIEQKLRQIANGARSKYGYKNLDRLRAIVAANAAVVKQADCLDVKDPNPTKLYVEMTAEQRKIYSALRSEFMVEFDGGISPITARLAITRLMKMRQVASGFVKLDDGATMPIKNNRVAALLDLLDYCPGSVVVWAHFQENIREIMAALAEKYGPNAAVAYYGEIGTTEREENRRKFEAGEVRFMVANQGSGGRGFNWSVARTMVYFTNDYRLTTRQQSEERLTTEKSAIPPTIVDVVAEDTVDELITRVLRDKAELSEFIIGKTAGELA